MKKLLMLLAALCLFTATAEAEDNRPTCVLLTFTDDTRYTAIESAAQLSDLVMEKMLAGRKFRLMELNPLPENMEALLYNEEQQALLGMEAALSKGDFNVLFEGAGFNEKMAQSIAAADQGQTISPSVTRAIGEAHNAEYLIQGTILQLGTGNWWTNDLAKIAETATLISGMAGSTAMSSLLGQESPLGMLLSGFDLKVVGIGVQCDLRVIKAESGEVVWRRRFTGVSKQNLVNLGFVEFGDGKLNSNLYAKAMDSVAKQAVDAMTQDMEAGVLFR